MRLYRVTRNVTRTECPWLDEEVPAGRICAHFMQPTYGCISPTGVAVSFEEGGDYPFTELPTDALEEVK